MTKTKILSPLASLQFAEQKLPVAKTFDDNNNDSTQSQYLDAPTAAIQFKYVSNADRGDIAQFRQLLTELRAEQLGTIDQEEYHFYESDYKRMLCDDWLVTRFLLRGKKVFERDAESGAMRYRILGMDCTNENQSQISSELDKRAILQHTIELVKVCAKYRFDYRITSRTNLNEFPWEWTKIDGLFHYEPDAVGNPTIYLRVSLHRPKLIEAPAARHLFKRYMLYTLEQCDQKLYNKPGKAICCVFDMTNVAFENIDLELTTWMIKSFKSSSPKLICYVIIYNPPWFFTATFKVICNTMLSSSKRQTVKFASGNEILNYIDRKNLPPYLASKLN